eukprot:COSAG01_NODE_9692_length_2369_cov_2.166960_1_plen_338_part_00
MSLRAVLVLAITAAASAVPGVPLRWRDLGATEKVRYTYEHFATEFGKDGSAGSRARFAAELARVQAHNALNLSWTEGMNQFSDMTPEEFGAFKGKVFTGVDASHLKFDSGVPTKELPAEIDWRDASKNPSKGVAVTPVKNQGGCGSCWAFSSTESVESAVYMQTGKLPTLAPQEFVDCIPNPNSCGGSGGCQGSTEEYGFAWAMIYGMASDATYNYTARTGTECLLNKGGRTPVAGISNFVKLPGNDYDSLMQAIATVGPVSISVDASWGAYEKGVYKGCKATSTTIDHAVQLVGYGTEAGEDYFLVRNSWGASWGEGGYIKLPRTATGPQTCGEDL